MKALRIILLVLGYALVIVNILSSVVMYTQGKLKITATPEGFGTLIGFTLFIWIGLVLIQQAKAIKKRIQEKEMQKTVDEIGE
jgi:hypothetical protein